MILLLATLALADPPDVPCDSSPLAAAYCECGVELHATRVERDGARAVVVERETERDGLKLDVAACRAGWTQETQAHALTKAKQPAQLRVVFVGGAVAGIVAASLVAIATRRPSQ